MRRTLLHSILCVLFAAMTISARSQEFTPTFMSQYDRIGVGVRGGMAGHMQSPSVPLGWETMLDVQYAHYWRHDSWHEQFGLIVGLSAGFSNSTYTCAVHEESSFTLTESGMTFPLDYVVDATVRERNSHIQLEIPLQFSMVMHCGWFLNLGPRLQLPMAGRYRQTVTDDCIAATYSQWSNQPIVNRPTTGCFDESTRHSEGAWRTPKVNVLVGGESGYEHMFNDKNRIAVGVYGHCGVLPRKSSIAADDRMVQIVPPSAECSASVSTLGLTNTYSTQVSYFAVGVRMAYYFVW